MRRRWRDDNDHGRSSRIDQHRRDRIDDGTAANNGHNNHNDYYNYDDH
jgi:hypothetical protein